MQRIVTFKIDDELLLVLDRYAREKNLTRSEVIREAIEKLLRTEGIKIPKRIPTLRYDPRSPIIEITV